MSKYSSKYQLRAVELYEEYTANEVFQHLAKEFPDKPHPNAKTLTRWQDTIHEEESAQKREEHFRQIAELATKILGGLGHIQPISKNNYKCYSSGKQSWFYNKILTREELIDALQNNMIGTYKQNSTLFKYLLTHLKAENPEYENLYKYLEKSPEEFLTLLQKVELRRDFQGKCDMCKGWK